LPDAPAEEDKPTMGFLATGLKAASVCDDIMVKITNSV